MALETIKNQNCIQVIHAFFSMICGWAGSKNNLGKAAGAEVAVKRRNGKKKMHAGITKHILKSK